VVPGPVESNNVMGFRRSFEYIHSWRDHHDRFIASKEAILTQMASAIDQQYLLSYP
jgi:hypothetical protein